jgi:hypothetical protein
MTAQQLDQSLRQVVNPANFVWVVVGDAAKVRPQLASLGLPIEEMKLAGGAPRRCGGCAGHGFRRAGRS